MKTLICAISILFLAGCSSVPYPGTLNGTYTLYDLHQVNVGPVGKIRISDNQGKTFSVYGDGWKGKGELADGLGYYDWQFADGKSGRTNLTLAEDGNLKGQVIGPKNDSTLNWEFLAKKDK